MNIIFQEADPEKALSAVQNALESRDLKKMVSIDFDGEDLVVTISKLGKSKLRFTPQATPKTLKYSLTQEKIALSHRVFKDEVIQEVREILEEADGTVED